jgi:hypothetical protein
MTISVRIAEFAAPYSRFGYQDLMRLGFGRNRFRTDGTKRTADGSLRTKDYAVSDDGAMLRCRPKTDMRGYHDTISVGPSGTATLRYVCGDDEECRRQTLLRFGAEVLVDVRSDRDGAECHAILVGAFVERIVVEQSVPGSEDTVQVPHTVVHMTGYMQDAEGTRAPLKREGDRREDSTDDEPSGKYVDGVINLPRPIPRQWREHIILDTESAAPPQFTTRGDGYAFPILQLAFVRVNDDMVVLSEYMSYCKYEAPMLAKIGNDESSSVLKFDPTLLTSGGRPTDTVVRDLIADIRRVVETGGCVIAHNVAHDLRQINATIDLLREGGDSSFADAEYITFRTFDTVKTASNFVVNAGRRWLKLDALATKCGVVPTEPLHDAMSDVHTLLDVVRTGFVRKGNRFDERMDAFSESYTLAHADHRS